MFKQTMRFERHLDAETFDQHLVDFLRYCEGDIDIADACLFSSAEQEADIHIRVVQTDNSQMLGRLLDFLVGRKFPPPIPSPVRAKPAGLTGAMSR
jgi:Tfp pilus assembly ATPase PilU